jgi:hypothetical protein
MKKFSLLVFIFCCIISFSQSKNENEERINPSEFPEGPRSYFNTINFQIKYLKFYKETDSTTYSFEAKFKLNKRYYSVEFDTLGNLQDIEINIKKKSIPKPVYKNMMSFFDSNFEKVNILKTQEQYINNSDKSDEEFINSILKKSTGKNNLFEIIAEVKYNGKRQFKEFTFKNNGNFLKSRFVKSEDYQYVLY